MLRSQGADLVPGTAECQHGLVIGGLKDEPGHLLLLGDDGQFYVYDADRAEVTVMAPGTSWAVDVVENCSLVFEAPVEMVAS